MSDDVLVAVFNADDGGMDAETWTRLRSWLQPEEVERADKYKDMEARASFLIGRGMARAMLAEATGVAPGDWRFSEGPHGRPEIASPDTPYRFNLAHSHGVIACALAKSRDIGVDVEFLDRPDSSHDVAARACSPDELADIASAPEDGRKERFLVYWTLKEAYLKARGLGISVHLGDVAFLIKDGEPAFAPRGSLAGADTRWHFRLAQPGPRHLVAVAVDTRNGATPNIRFQRFAATRFPAA
ncbi:MAG: 4'-phosphopantetheinyl transferase superfamily protein [Acidobacteria bacterium]|nr:MAG: 4'-phosphopantetheinyl transferase superfamily protein [Acidobacteriota bacterium]